MSRRIPLLVATLVMAAACSSGEAAPPSTTATTMASPSGPSTGVEPAPGFPVVVETGDGTVTIEQRPEAIISLSPTATEMLFAVGAGEQVVAVDDQSDYPVEAPVTDLSGLTPNVEAIAGFGPDLVVIGFDPGDLAPSLEAIGVPVLLMPAAADLEDTYDQIEQLGLATGNAAGAAAVVAGMQGEIEAILDGVGPVDPAPTYYHELDPSLYTATSTTFIGQVYGLLGLENVADAADADGFGYPQLSAEYLIEQDPDLIFLADTVCCGETAASVAERPGWSELSAIREGAVIELDDAVASRWGPRVVDFLRVVAEALESVRPTSP